MNVSIIEKLCEMYPEPKKDDPNHDGVFEEDPAPKGEPKKDEETHEPSTSELLAKISELEKTISEMKNNENGD